MVTKSFNVSDTASGLFYSLFFSFFLLEGTGWGGEYDPSRTIASPTSRPINMAVRDAKRDREIPIKVYLPASTAPAPVLLVSHGLGGSRDGGRYLGTHWSARGYVVVAMQHHGSDIAIWKDVPRLRRLAEMRKAASAENALARFRDVPAVLDQLQIWNGQTSHPLHQRLNVQLVGMSGHSFGAATTQGVSGQAAPRIGPKFTDKRIVAALMLSPNRPRYLDPEDAFSSVLIPWMLMTGTQDTSPINDTTVEDRRSVYPALPTSVHKYELVLDGAEHSAFSDASNSFRDRRRNPNHHRSILALSTAFWDAHLLGNEDAKHWLHGDSVRARLDPDDQWQFHAIEQDAVVQPRDAPLDLP